MTRLQFRILYREFLFRMVDLELLAPQGEMTKLLGQFAAVMIALSLFGSIVGFSFADSRLPPQARLLVAWMSEHFLISTTMLVVGLYAVLSWDSTFPNRRDVLVLAPLPIRARTLFLAKVAAVITALILTVIALHVAAGFVWPYAFSRQSAALSAPALRYDPAMAAVDTGGMESVLKLDLAEAQKPGAALAPGTHAGVVVGVSRRGVRRVFAYGTARPDSISSRLVPSPRRLLLLRWRRWLLKGR